MNKSKLAVVIASLLLASAGVAAVEKDCVLAPTGEWVCEPVMQPMGPGSGGTGGEDPKPPVPPVIKE